MRFSDEGICRKLEENFQRAIYKSLMLFAPVFPDRDQEISSFFTQLTFMLDKAYNSNDKYKVSLSVCLGIARLKKTYVYLEF